MQVEPCSFMSPCSEGKLQSTALFARYNLSGQISHQVVIQREIIAARRGHMTSRSAWRAGGHDDVDLLAKLLLHLHLPLAAYKHTYVFNLSFKL